MPHAIITPNIRTTRAEAHYVRLPIAAAATAAAGLVIYVISVHAVLLQTVALRRSATASHTHNPSTST